MTKNADNPRFHWACHNEWEGTPEGRQFQSLKLREKRTPEGSQPRAKEDEPGNYGAPLEAGPDPSSVAAPKGGRPKRYSDKNAGHYLATAYRWLIQYCSPEKKSLRQIGEESDVPFNTVRDQIRSLVEEFKKLPTLELLADDFQTVVRELLAAYDERIREVKDRAISSIPSSSLPRTA